jgi:predicted small integral membrane protein
MKTLTNIFFVVLTLLIPDILLWENNQLGFEPFTQVGFMCLRLISLLVAAVITLRSMDLA